MHDSANSSLFPVYERLMDRAWAKRRRTRRVLAAVHTLCTGTRYPGGAERMVNVWWIYATDDDRQHGSTSVPPREGGMFQALCEHDFVAPPGAENTYRTQGTKPFCMRCLAEYCLVCSPAPVWTY